LHVNVAVIYVNFVKIVSTGTSTDMRLDRLNGLISGGFSFKMRPKAQINIKNVRKAWQKN
jgi:hypothetical protein